jgi:beta-lactamase regulating signal transducer with metallopeptidase domain
MTADRIIDVLMAANLAGSLAILAVLLLRGLIRRLAGARLAYMAWLIVPAAILAIFLPARTIETPAPPPMPSTGAAIGPPPTIGGFTIEQPLATHEIAEVARIPIPAPAPAMEIDWTLLLAIVWAAGAFAALVFLTIRQLLAIRALGPLTPLSPTTSRATQSEIGPAVVGVLAPRIVLPANFEAAFTDAERKVVLAHEEAHLHGRHTAVKTAVEIAVCLSWFNPLAYLAARAIAMDQELACDEAVAARYPHDRKAYAGALLKTQAGPRLPLGCYWPAQSARRLKTRIARLGLAAPGRNRRVAGAAFVLVCGLGAGVAAWAGQPPRFVPVHVVAAPSLSEAVAPLEPAPSSPPVAEDQPAPAPQTPAAPQMPETRPPWQWSNKPVPAGFDAADPVSLSGTVEKIEFRDTTYVVFVRASTIITADNAPPAAPGLPSPRPNSSLWQLSPTNYWGDRDAVNADLLGKRVAVRGYNAIDKTCAPACRMSVENIRLEKSTALPPLSETPAFSAVDFALHYNTAASAAARNVFMGRVQRVEFGDRTFDIYVQTDVLDENPNWTYQVRSEYRHPRADIEKLLLNQVIVVAGWPAKRPMDTVLQSPVGVFGTDFELANGMQVTPAGEKLLSEAPRELQLGADPDALPFIPPGFAKRVATFDMTAMVTIEGKIVRADAESVWVEAESFDPVSMPGATPGAVWRVMIFGGGTSNIGKTITVRGWAAKDKSCQPTCLMESRQSSIR